MALAAKFEAHEFLEREGLEDRVASRARARASGDDIVEGGDGEGEEEEDDDDNQEEGDSDCVEVTLRLGPKTLPAHCCPAFQLPLCPPPSPLAPLTLGSSWIPPWQEEEGVDEQDICFASPFTEAFKSGGGLESRRFHAVVLERERGWNAWAPTDPVRRLIKTSIDHTDTARPLSERTNTLP